MKSPRHSRAVEFRAGVHVMGSVLWCDAVHARECCFVSSARLASAAARRHRQIITSAATAALLGRSDTGVLPAPLGRPFHLGRLRLEPFASGAGLGAASLLVEDAGRRLVHAGAIAARPALTAEAADKEAIELSGVRAFDPQGRLPAGDLMIPAVPVRLLLPMAGLVAIYLLLRGPMRRAGASSAGSS